MKKIMLLTLLLNALGLYSQNIQKVCVVAENGTTISFAPSQVDRFYFFIDKVASNNEKCSTLVLNFKQNNNIAVYDKTIMNYRYYPSTVKMNFNPYSPRVANKQFSPIKMDSLNPCGTSQPKTAIVLGALDYILQKIQN